MSPEAERLLSCLMLVLTVALPLDTWLAVTPSLPATGAKVSENTSAIHDLLTRVEPEQARQGAGAQGGLTHTPAAASEPGPSTPLPAKHSKRTKAEQAAEPTQPTKGKGKGNAAKAKPAPQPGRWLDRDCDAALNMQRIGESRWRPLELCYWPDQGVLPAKGKEYTELGYKRL
ncbi:hypothetical protein V8C86DRAFT_2668604 [Haematococcus lacustris]